jgi:hypothetical protein
VRIFVGFGYNPRDEWIKELVFPLVQAFGDEVVTGEDMAGDILSETVKDKIRTSDGMIGFLTRRDPINEGRWTTHRWVTDELAHAAAIRMAMVEVRETGIDPQGGGQGDRQWLPYDEANRAQFLVPQILPLYRQREFTCQYRLLLPNGDETEPKTVQLRPVTGGLFVELKGVPRDALVQAIYAVDGRAISDPRIIKAGEHGLMFCHDQLNG